MRVPRALLVLAILAALWGAPSSVSAAANELSSGQVSPGSGSVITVFTFRVRYEGSFPAATVVVNVAGATVSLVLESGSLTAGWWSGASLLPLGAWPTLFRATAARGPAAVIAGPVVAVVAAATPPAATPRPTVPGPGATPESAPAVNPDDTTTAPAAPAPAPDVAATAAAATPAPGTPDAAPAAPPSDAPGSSSGDGPNAVPAAPESSEGDSQPPPEDEDAAPAASVASVPAPADGTSRIRPAADGEPEDEAATGDEMVSGLIMLGLAGVASVAIFGTLLLLAGRRREPDPVPANPAPTIGVNNAPRRVPSGSRARPAHDPIVAALGVDDEMAARRAIRRARRAVSDDAAPSTGRAKKR